MKSKKKKVIFPDNLFIAKKDVATTIQSNIPDIVGYAAFAVDASNEKQVKKARDWAGASSYVYMNGSYTPVSSQYSDYIEKNVPKIMRLVGSEYRSNNIVFKVISEDNLIFDLRQDEAMYVIQKYGVSPGGEINTKFIWCIRSGYMRLCQEDRINEVIVEDILT